MAKYKLLLPKMGESVAEATIIKWTKNPGDYIETDDTVMEIATDKVDSDVPSPVSGKLLEQLCQENDVVQVGAVIAIIETDEPEEVKEEAPIPPMFRSYNEEQPVFAPEPAPVAEEIQQPIEEAPAPVAEEMPAAAGQGPVYTYENHFVSPEPRAQPVEEFKQPIFEELSEEQLPPVPYTEQLERRGTVNTENGIKNPLRFYSPLVKNIAAQEGVSNAELDQISGTGADGRLTKDDLLAYIQNKYKPGAETKAGVVEAIPAPPTEPAAFPQSAVETKQPVPVAETRQKEPVTEQPKPEPVVEAEQPTPVVEAPKVIEPVKPEAAESKVTATTSVSGGDEIIEMDRMRRLIAEHMVMSKHTSPHVTSFVEADVTNLVLWRDKIKGSFEKREGEKITFTPIFIEAVIRAIKDLPMINIQVKGTQIIKKKDINISMATALPSGNLIVPVIKKADELSLLGITKAVNDLANRARTGKLKPDDTQGGTFTITNVGSFGNVMGTPIINQPQVAILAVGAIKKKPAVIETLQGDMIGIRHMMFLSLSYDHRVVDGALGGSFVRRVADYLENWDPGREI
jgi:2-oxoglutarate dehydrogenase E2 component (dihydrolipoamide succinyltransferase)